MNYDMNNLRDIAVRNSYGMQKLAALVGGGGMPANPALPTGPKSAIPLLGNLAKMKGKPSQQQGTGKQSTTLTIKADGDGVQALKDILSARLPQQQPEQPGQGLPLN